ncbi:sporulation membrane protein YtaF [Proteiniborus sp. MB09-C3]|uniref:sporulation membrane protein YtaF n=1 Tax=Proteiniborus sp. MB09-C3 TaxID=3050072 RepID=UPI002554E149|nr:sporulation membrane protein YtaF [Proteiniborus sp. MB09-C3]WIV13333.1 sporulation membrane protein YtaF [Proteiniborus sp. MB09-C3]
MLEALLLVIALSLDAFVASIAYGTSKIKIPISSVAVISTICSFILAISLFLGSILKMVLPNRFATTISFIALMLLGIYYLLEGIVKANLRKSESSNKRIKFRFADMQLVLDIYLDETRADLDNSKNLNPREALYLAIALSIDSLAVGFASSLGEVNYILAILFSLVAGAIAILAGLFLGRKLAETAKINLSWLSGALLLVLAILKLV